MGNKIITKEIKKSIGISLSSVEHKRLWNYINTLEDKNLSKWVLSLIVKELDYLKVQYGTKSN